MSKFRSTMLFMETYRHEIILAHMYIGLAGGAFAGYVSAPPYSRIRDTILCGSVGGLLGMFPPMIWGVGAAIAYKKITKKD